MNASCFDNNRFDRSIMDKWTENASNADRDAKFFLPNRKHKNFKIFIFLIAALLVQMPASAYISDLLQGFEHRHFARLTITQYLFFSAFFLIPLLTSWNFLLKRVDHSFSVIANTVRTFIALVTVIVSYVFSVQGFLYLHTDAQAAIAFVVLPLYASALPLLTHYALLLVEKFKKS